MIFKCYLKNLDWLKATGIILLSLIPFKEVTLNFKLIIIYLISFFSLAFARGINDYFDGQIEKEKNCFSQNKTPLIAVYLPMFIALLLDIIFLKRLSLMFALFLLFISFSYSHPILRLRNIPVLDIISNQFIAVSTYSFAYFYYHQFSGYYILFAFILLTDYLVLELIHQISHYKKDLKSGRKTSVILMGIDRVKFVLNIIFVTIIFVSIAIIVYLKKEKVSYFLFSSIIFTLLRAIKVNKIKVSDKIRTKLFLREEFLSYILIEMVSNINF